MCLPRPMPSQHLEEAWAGVSARTQEERRAMFEEAVSMLYGMVCARACTEYGDAWEPWGHGGVDRELRLDPA